MCNYMVMTGLPHTLLFSTFLPTPSQLTSFPPFLRRPRCVAGIWLLPPYPPLLLDSVIIKYLSLTCSLVDWLATFSQVDVVILLWAPS